MKSTALDKSLDIRAEFRAIQLAEEYNLPLGNILLRPQNSFNRKIRLDVLKELEIGDPESFPNCLTIDVSRDGVLRKSGHDIESDIEDKLGLLLDYEFNLVRTSIELAEQNYIFEEVHTLLADSNEVLFDSEVALETLSQYIASRYPVLHHFVGSLEKTEQLLNQALGIKVILLSENRFKKVLRDRSTPDLGNTCLGSDFIIGNECISRLSHINISVEIDDSRLLDYLFDSVCTKKISMLCDLLFPLECTYSISLSGLNNKFTVSDDGCSARLGYTTNL